MRHACVPPPIILLPRLQRNRGLIGDGDGDDESDGDGDGDGTGLADILGCDIHRSRALDRPVPLKTHLGGLGAMVASTSQEWRFQRGRFALAPVTLSREKP